MCDTYREQRPLLCDDLSEEEHFSSQFPRRYRPMVCVGRARNNAKGAVAVITHWPEHWSSSLSYWWIGIGVMALTIFITYNIILASTLLPTAHLKSLTPQMKHKIANTYNGSTFLPNVFMHLFVNQNEEADLNKYLPYIKIISKEYADFKFNLIIVHKDISDETNALSAEEHNEIALNSLWTKEYYSEKHKINKHNINIEYVTLSKYMDESPLRKNWRFLPHQFMEFLVKCISIWDKGGIALNPIILTPESPHTLYIEKLRNLLQNYNKSNNVILNDAKPKNKILKTKDTNKQKVNNIRDIIDILENDDNTLNASQISLTEAEDQNNPIFTRRERKWISDIPKTKRETSNDEIHTKIHSILTDKTYENENLIQMVKNKKVVDISKDDDDKLQSKSHFLLERNQTRNVGLLPLFLDFLFHGKSTSNMSNNLSSEEMSTHSVTRKRKSVIISDNLIRNYTSGQLLNKSETHIMNESYKPMIISAKGITSDELLKNDVIKEKANIMENFDLLTIDLNGNILATKTACHAFIGTVFSNVIHHTSEETLKDFVIAELSIFCKGLLSSCKGIEVILL